MTKQIVPINLNMYVEKVMGEETLAFKKIENKKI